MTRAQQIEVASRALATARNWAALLRKAEGINVMVTVPFGTVATPHWDLSEAATALVLEDLLKAADARVDECARQLATLEAQTEG